MPDCPLTESAVSPDRVVQQGCGGDADFVHTLAVVVGLRFSLSSSSLCPLRCACVLLFSSRLPRALCLSDAWAASWKRMLQHMPAAARPLAESLVVSPATSAKTTFFLRVGLQPDNAKFQAL